MFCGNLCGISHIIDWFMYRIITLMIAAGILLLALAADFGYKNALHDLSSKADREAQLKIMLLQAILDKQRTAAQILAQDPDIISSLQRGDVHQLQLINLKLANLAVTTKATVIYVLDNQGTAIAASNWQNPDSFVGNNFAYRQYFLQTQKERAAEHFAQGAVSHKPGLYIARTIKDDNQQNIGVIVSKIEFTELESSWQNPSSVSFISNFDDIIIVASWDMLRFKSLKSLTAEQHNKITQSMQFGDANLDHLIISPDKNSIVQLDNRKFFYHKQLVAGTNWHFYFLLDAQNSINNALFVSLISVSLVIMIISGLLGFLWRKNIRTKQIKEQESKYKQILEQQVSLRTSELYHSNLALRQEIEQRVKTEKQLTSLSKELAKANRLAILGQSIAAVAHEVNQPLTAIRSYAENAQIFLQRVCADDFDNLAYANLQRIVALTERIYSITDNLRNFARKDRSQIVKVSLKEVINGALMVLSSRIDQANCQIDPKLPPANWCVLATQIRLEQVLINLIQNAIEACSSKDNPQIQIYVEEQDQHYALCVRDNGLGMSDQIKANLFTPFNTNKDNGLGLGLVISQDIVQSFAGEINCVSDASGTCFTVLLKKHLF